MPTSYTLLFFGPEGTLIRQVSRRCADLNDALRFATRQHDLCARVTIYGDGRTLWDGSPVQAMLAVTDKEMHCEGSGVSVR